MSDRSCPICGKDAPIDTGACECGYAFSSTPTYAVDRESHADRTDAPGAGWQLVGWVLIVAGFIGLFLSVIMKTSIPSPVDFLGPEIVNLDLQFQKGLAITASFFTIGSGIFSLGISAIVNAIERREGRK